ncbi:hypothetical protein ACVME5_006178 [Bradyrhizobium liaoningense]
MTVLLMLLIMQHSNSAYFGVEPKGALASGPDSCAQVRAKNRSASR